jgi:hypothetical protein
MWWRASSLRETVDRVVTPRRVLIAGWVLFVVYAYPGYMSYDSVWQLQQARKIEPLSEWHPPLMAFLWRWTDSIVSGPFPMLVIQSTAFLLGAAALLRRVMSPRAAALTAVAVLLAPPNLVVLAVVWKDCQMAGFLIASIAALLSPRRWVRVCGYFFVFLATGVRYNAAAATLPIVLGLFAWGSALPRLRRYAIATALWLGITAAAVVASALLIEKRTHPWEIGSTTVDIVGTLRFTDEVTDADLLRWTPGVPWTHTDKLWSRIRTSYHPANQWLDLTQGERKLIEHPSNDEQLAALAAAWKTIVLAHPLAFLRHRISLFLAQLENRTGGAGGFWVGFTPTDWTEDSLEHRARRSPVQKLWIKWHIKFDAWFGLRVWAYFVLGLCLLPMCRRDRVTFVVQSSGIMYQLGLLMVAPAIDYRYSHWMVVATIVTAVLLFATRLRGSRGLERGSPCG